jgi:hypothetical protein
MTARAIFSMVLVAGMVLSERCNAQVKQFGQIDGALKGKEVIVLQQDVCTYPYFLKGTLEKALSNGETGKFKDCEIYRCTNRDLLNECPRVGANFTVKCINGGTVAVAKNGSSFSVEVSYHKESWRGRPVCEQYEITKTAKVSLTVQLVQQPPPPSQSSAQNPSQGLSLWGRIRCGVLGSIYKDNVASSLHPECK